MAAPSRQRVALAARLSQVEQLGRRVRLDHGLVGDIGDTLRALVPKLSEHSDDRHLKAALEHYRKARKDLDSWRSASPARSPSILNTWPASSTRWPRRTRSSLVTWEVRRSGRPATSR